MPKDINPIKRYTLYIVFTILALSILIGCIPLQRYDDERNTNPIEIEVKKEGNSQKEGYIQEEELRTITVSAVGDIMVHSPQFQSAYVGDGKYDFVPVFEEVKKIIVDSDLALCNLETTISTPERGYSGYPCFKTPEELISAIKDAGFNVVTTANNHSLDGREFGVVHTLDVLDKHDLWHAGTARNQLESEKILIVERKGIKLGILAYTYGTNGMEATVDQDKLKYMVNYIKVEEIEEDIKRARQEGADAIILCMHWGVEYDRAVGEEQKRLADKLFDAGADIILGSHPHVIQTMEKKTVSSANGEDREVFVAYSLGNFISNQRDRYRDSGVIVNITITKEGNKTIIEDVKYIPTWVRKFKQDGKVQYSILPVEEFIDSPLPTPDLNRLRAVWKETKDIIGNEIMAIKGD